MHTIMAPMNNKEDDEQRHDGKKKLIRSLVPFASFVTRPCVFTTQINR
jgi:hypothetical protein